MNEQELLYEYKQYDGINNNKPLVKILVSYIKPSFLFKSEILTPIHLGRAVESDTSKDGLISGDDIKWLHENCIGDDGFEGNISGVNRRVGFLTGTYWAWKNYEKLGNPEYFGSFGYRRLFSSSFIKNIKHNDFIAPFPVDFSKTGGTIHEHIKKLHGEKLLNEMYSVVKKIYPTEVELFSIYMHSNKSYSYEMYVMKKKLFFDFCEWIFPILFEFLKIDFIENSVNSLEAAYFSEIGEKRDVAYAMEFITGYYIYKITNNPNIKYENANIVNIKSVEQNNRRNQIITRILRNKVKNERI